MNWIIFLEVLIVVYFIGLWFYMNKKGYKNTTRKLIILFFGVLLFEVMSEPMWLNLGFHKWAYLYKDITWIITIGWVNIFTTSFLLVDYHFGHIIEYKRFWLYLFFVEAITVPLETLLLQTGIREYAGVLTSTMIGKTIPLTIVPIEAIYAIPLFATLIICFYKYVNYLFETGVKND
ncbi:hypothetical protein HON49_02050 [archaeon]|nr:hypothetical protein [archaeon]